MRPSERIKVAGELAELEWLRKYKDDDYNPKASVVTRLKGQLSEIKQVLDELYEASTNGATQAPRKPTKNADVLESE